MSVMVYVINFKFSTAVKWKNAITCRHLFETYNFMDNNNYIQKKTTNKFEIILIQLI